MALEDKIKQSATTTMQEIPRESSPKSVPVTNPTQVSGQRKAIESLAPVPYLFPGVPKAKRPTGMPSYVKM
jgi:hypothetical protein